MASFKGLVISSLLVALIIVCVFQGYNQFASDNNLNNSLSGNSPIQNLTNQLNQATGQSANEQSTNLTRAFQNEGSNPHLTALGFFFTSIVSAGSILITSTSTIFNAVLVYANDTLGLNPVIIGTLAAIVLIVMMFAAWQMLRQGS